jgi:hypothetical protein
MSFVLLSSSRSKAYITHLIIIGHTLICSLLLVIANYNGRKNKVHVGSFAIIHVIQKISLDKEIFLNILKSMIQTISLGTPCITYLPLTQL